MDIETATQQLKQTFLRGAMAGLVVGALLGAMLAWNVTHPESLTEAVQSQDCEDV